MTGFLGTGTRFVAGRRRLDGKGFTKYILLAVTLGRLVGKGDRTLCFGSVTPASQVPRGHLNDFFNSSNDIVMM